MSKGLPVFRAGVIVGLVAVTLSGLVTPARAIPQSNRYDLLTDFSLRIDGAVGESALGGGDYIASSVSHAGDVNGDGIDDVVIGAYHADSNGLRESGSAYVVFGEANTQFPSTIDLANFGATRGFRIDGAAVWDWAGISVDGAGDVNGDGFDDVIVGASKADNNGREASGSAYVVFGSGNDTGTVDLGALGSRGFRIDGAARLDEAGVRVAGVDDLSGDGIPDVIVGAPGADNNGYNSGSAYVVFGNGRDTSTVDLAALGSRGFRIDGATGGWPHGDDLGREVSGAGDVNDDGIPDVIVGAANADNNGDDSGSAYVVFGNGNDTSTVDVGALGSRGFRIDGAQDVSSDNGASLPGAGHAVSDAGDVNDDGIADVMVGAPNADNNGRTNSGSAYVVFGKRGGTGTVNLAALGSRGFRIDGAAGFVGNCNFNFCLGDQAGWSESISGTGDVSGDGVPDVIVGSHYADNNGRGNSGAAYVIFGKSGTDPVDLANIGNPDNSEGILLDGAAANDWAGTAASGAGDFNDDGALDVIVGAPGADNNLRRESGSAYLIFNTWTTSTAQGTKFEDSDGDGRPREPGEQGLPGWTIYVDYDGNGQLGGSEPSDVTGANGEYTIRGVRPGRYAIREVGRAGWTCSYPAPCSYSETFTSGGTETGKDFGNWTSPPPPPPPPPPGIKTPLGQPNTCNKVLYENKLRVSREIRLSDLIKGKGANVYASASEASSGYVKIEINGRQARQFKIYRKTSKIKSKLFARRKVKIGTKPKAVYLKAKGREARLIRKALRLKRAPKRTKLKVSLMSQATANKRLKRLNTQTIRALRRGKVRRTDTYTKIRQVLDKTGCGQPLRASIKGPRQTKLTVLTTKKAKQGRGTKVTVECSEDCTAMVGYRLWGRYEIGLKFRKKGQTMNRLLFERKVKLSGGEPRTLKLGGVVSKKLRKLLVRGAKKRRYDRVKMKYVIEARSTDNRSAARSGTSRVLLRFR